MFASPQPRRRNHRGLASALSCAVLIIGFGLAAPAAMAAGFDGGDGAAGGGKLKAGGGGAEGGAETGAGGKGAVGPNGQTDLTTCAPGQVWDAKQAQVPGETQRRSARSRTRPNTHIALAKADRCQEAIDVLDTLENPNTPRGAQLPRLCDPQTRAHRGRDRLLSEVCRAQSQLPAGARISRRGLCHRGQIRSRQGSIVDDREALRIEGSATYYQDLADALDKAHAL